MKIGEALPPQGGSEISSAHENDVEYPGGEVAFLRDVLAATEALAESRGAQLATKEKEIEALYKDALTKLPNEYGLRRYENRRRMHPEYKNATVMFLDVNRFKQINDSLGHTVADEIIQRVGEYLKKIARSTDTVVRLHGDEFVIIFEGATEEEVMKKFEDKPLVFTATYGDGKEIEVSLSAGITTYGTDKPFEVAMKDADTAMYQSKKKRDGSVVRFTPEGSNARPLESEQI
jgi:diguanylate cyclase (GGDEF)-like protein